MRMPRSLQGTTMVRLFLALWLAITPTFVWAGSMTLLGVGSLAAAPTYQGIGDVVTAASPLAWGSCARVYTAAQASTSTNLCDLVDSAAPTVVICTLRGSSTGFVDLVGTYCTGGVTPATKCAAATGAVCNISQIYDQTGSSRPWTQATAANQPTLTFAAVNSLPVITCNGTTSRMDTAAITQAQPFTLSAVYNRTSGTAAGTAIGTASGGILIGAHSLANQGKISAGTVITFTGATDASYHSLSGVFNGASGAWNLDGTDTTSVNAGANAFTANTLRFCTDGASFIVGRIAEGGLWASALSVGQRGAIYTNQHGANGYNGAF